MRFLFAFAISLQCFLAQADNIRYSILTLDTSLSNTSNAVIRLEETSFEIKSLTETIYKEHIVITVLNEKGARYASFDDWYDKNREINSIDGTLYDAMGKEIKSVKKKDIADGSGADGGTLATDDRYKAHNFYYKIYPYTVEYEWEVKNKHTMFFPSWVAQPGSGVAVEKSSMTVITRADYKFRYQTYNINKEPEITQAGDKRSYVWNIGKLKAYIQEPFGPMAHEMTPTILLGPTDFQYEDYKGNMATWQDFGRFVYELKKSRDVLPDNVKAKVHQIADGITDKRQKIAKLYEFMQAHTRYVSVQLGIGGWQPFDAKYVGGNGYGDCKALTNYMYSILKEAGLPSIYTVIRAGRNERYITENFPSQQFNHVILSVPLGTDTVWLECTDQSMPAGYLGYFTNDRPAFLITENGGKMARTPRYGLKENLQLKKLTGTVNDDGSLTLHAVNYYSGLEQDDIHDNIHALSKEKLKEELQEQFDFSTYDITSFNYKERFERVPAIDETLDIDISNYASITGKRLFVQPNVMTRLHTRLTPDSTRKYDVVLFDASTDIDSVEIAVPAGYTVESLPKAAAISSPFGNYFTETSFSNNKILFRRKFEWLSGRFPAASYAEMVKFLDAIYKADRVKAVLVKQQ